MTTLDTWLPLLRSPGGTLPLRGVGDALVDDEGGRYPITDGIPRLVSGEEPAEDDARWTRLYDRAASVYGWTERAGARVMLGMDLRTHQRRLVAGLPIRAGDRVLEVSPGPGVFQPWLAEAVGPDGELAAVDLSWGMARQCAAQTRRQTPAPLVCQGNADALPFADGAFDVLFHFGGIKLFGRPRRAFEEFARVVRPGGHVIVGDEGFAPDLPDGPRRRMMARLNPGFHHAPPAPPPQLALSTEEWVYDGYAFLWTLTRVGAPA